MATKSTKNKQKKTFNFGTSFKNSVSRGAPASTVVANLAGKHGKTQNWVWNHLHKNGFVNRRSFNGSWIYWANNGSKQKASSFSHNKSDFWQNAIEWAISSGYCTPQQISSFKSQKDFFNFFGPFFANQFNWSISSGWTWSKAKNWGKTGTTTRRTTTTKRTGTTSKRKSTTSKSRTSRKRVTSRKRTTARSTSTRTFKFPKSTASRSRRAA